MAFNLERFISNACCNSCQSFYDHYVEANVRFRSKLGMKAVIIRRQLGHCCDWCANLAGIYDPSDAPDDIYRRHSNCRCLVTYKSQDGYQNVWNKKIYQTQREARKEKLDGIMAKKARQIIYTSSKTQKVLDEQPKVSEEDYLKMVKYLNENGIAVERSPETDRWLDKTNNEGIVMHDNYGDTIIYHTKLSYSGMWEEAVHVLEQIRKGKIYENGTKGNYLCEIEAKEILISRAKEYKISDYEIRELKKQIENYKILLKRIDNGQ